MPLDYPKRTDFEPVGSDSGCASSGSMIPALLPCKLKIPNLSWRLWNSHGFAVNIYFQTLPTCSKKRSIQRRPGSLATHPCQTGKLN